jgi:OOP family OmpA-OmpF porin
MDKFAQSEANKYDTLFSGNSDRTYHDAVLGLGLYLPLGADPNAAEELAEPREPTSRIVIAATDTDGDQIPDDRDACPGTPPGVMIDVRGCERDTDADGVPNSQDACKTSPADSIVGADGCPPDSDADGIIDATDQCPSTPAGLSVLADGCALTGDCRIPAAGQRIDVNGCAVGSVILKGVNFENGKAGLKSLGIPILQALPRPIKNFQAFGRTP